MVKKSSTKSPKSQPKGSQKGTSAFAGVAAVLKEDDVVRLKTAGADSELGRVCRVMDITCKVQFETLGCRQVRKQDLELAVGDAPACNGCS